MPVLDYSRTGEAAQMKAGSIRIEPILATLLPVDKIVAEVQGALEETGKKMQEKFARTTSAWNEPTSMGYEVGDGEVWSGPSDNEEMNKKWQRLDDGVEPHTIVPSTGNLMIFPFQGVNRSYTPSTRVRQFASGRRAKHGPLVKRRIIKMHPGHAPREWSDEMIQQELEPFARRVQAAVDKGLG
jgi:hypothetical protein